MPSYINIPECIHTGGIHMKSWISHLSGVKDRSASMSFLIIFSVILISVLAGVLSAGGMHNETRDSIASIVNTYTMTGKVPQQGFLKDLTDYAVYPAVIFGFGLSALGIAVIPVLTAVKGFTFAFTTSVCIGLYGARGILLALAVTGMRNIVLLPCIMILSTDGVVTSLALFGSVYGIGSKILPVRPDYKGYTKKFILICAVLIAAVLLERAVSPGVDGLAVKTIP